MAATRRERASEEEDLRLTREDVERPRRGGGDLGPRILFAIPAIAFALFIVLEGGEVFALGLLVLGVVALRELYTLMGRVRPPALAGFLALAGLLVAALYGEPRHVVMVLVAAVPVTFLLALVRPRRAERVLGHRRHALRSPVDRRGHGARRVAAGARPARSERRRHRDRQGAADRRADRHVPGRHVRLLRGALLRPDSAGAADLAQQDARGAGHRGGGRARPPSGSPASTRIG